MSENIHSQIKGKKAVLIVLLSLAHEAKNMRKGELAAEIRKGLERTLAKMPWVGLKNLIIVEE